MDDDHSNLVRYMRTMRPPSAIRRGNFTDPKPKALPKDRSSKPDKLIAIFPYDPLIEGRKLYIPEGTPLGLPERLPSPPKPYSLPKDPNIKYWNSTASKALESVYPQARSGSSTTGVPALILPPREPLSVNPAQPGGDIDDVDDACDTGDVSSSYFGVSKAPPRSFITVDDIKPNTASRHTRTTGLPTTHGAPSAHSSTHPLTTRSSLPTAIATPSFSTQLHSRPARSPHRSPRKYFTRDHSPPVPPVLSVPLLGLPEPLQRNLDYWSGRAPLHAHADSDAFLHGLNKAARARLAEDRREQWREKAVRDGVPLRAVEAVAAASDTAPARVAHDSAAPLGITNAPPAPHAPLSYYALVRDSDTDWRNYRRGTEEPPTAGSGATAGHTRHRVPHAASATSMALTRETDAKLLTNQSPVTPSVALPIAVPVAVTVSSTGTQRQVQQRPHTAAALRPAHTSTGRMSSDTADVAVCADGTVAPLAHAHARADQALTSLAAHQHAAAGAHATTSSCGSESHATSTSESSSAPPTSSPSSWQHASLRPRSAHVRIQPSPPPTPSSASHATDPHPAPAASLSVAARTATRARPHTAASSRQPRSATHRHISDGDSTGNPASPGFSGLARSLPQRPASALTRGVEHPVPAMAMEVEAPLADIGALLHGPLSAHALCPSTRHTRERTPSCGRDGHAPVSVTLHSSPSTPASVLADARTVSTSSPCSTQPGAESVGVEPAAEGADAESPIGIAQGALPPALQPHHGSLLAHRRERERASALSAALRHREERDGERQRGREEGDGPRVLGAPADTRERATAHVRFAGVASTAEVPPAAPRESRSAFYARLAVPTHTRSPVQPLPTHFARPHATAGAYARPRSPGSAARKAEATAGAEEAGPAVMGLDGTVVPRVGQRLRPHTAGVTRAGAARDAHGSVHAGISAVDPAAARGSGGGRGRPASAAYHRAEPSARAVGLPHSPASVQPSATATRPAPVGADDPAAVIAGADATSSASVGVGEGEAAGVEHEAMPEGVVAGDVHATLTRGLAATEVTVACGAGDAVGSGGVGALLRVFGDILGEPDRGGAAADKAGDSVECEAGADAGVGGGAEAGGARREAGSLQAPVAVVEEREVDMAVSGDHPAGAAAVDGDAGSAEDEGGADAASGAPTRVGAATEDDAGNNVDAPARADSEDAEEDAEEEDGALSETSHTLPCAMASEDGITDLEYVRRGDLQAAAGADDNPSLACVRTASPQSARTSATDCTTALYTSAAPLTASRAAGHAVDVNAHSALSPRQHAYPPVLQPALVRISGRHTVGRPRTAQPVRVPRLASGAARDTSGGDAHAGVDVSARGSARGLASGRLSARRDNDTCSTQAGSASARNAAAGALVAVVDADAVDEDAGEVPPATYLYQPWVPQSLLVTREDDLTRLVCRQHGYRSVPPRTPEEVIAAEVCAHGAVGSAAERLHARRRVQKGGFAAFVRQQEATAREASRRAQTHASRTVAESERDSDASATQTAPRRQRPSTAPARAKHPARGHAGAPEHPSSEAAMPLPSAAGPVSAVAAYSAHTAQRLKRRVDGLLRAIDRRSAALEPSRVTAAVERVCEELEVRSKDRIGFAASAPQGGRWADSVSSPSGTPAAHAAGGARVGVEDASAPSVAAYVQVMRPARRAALPPVPASPPEPSSTVSATGRPSTDVASAPTPLAVLPGATAASAAAARLMSPTRTAASTPLATRASQMGVPVGVSTLARMSATPGAPPHAWLTRGHTTDAPRSVQPLTLDRHDMHGRHSERADHPSRDSEFDISASDFRNSENTSGIYNPDVFRIPPPVDWSY